MAGQGRVFTFHGAFSAKADAVKKERRVPGSHIRVCRFRKRRGKNGRGKLQTRYCVVT